MTAERLKQILDLLEPAIHARDSAVTAYAKFDARLVLRPLAEDLADELVEVARGWLALQWRQATEFPLQHQRVLARLADGDHAAGMFEAIAPGGPGWARVWCPCDGSVHAWTKVVAWMPIPGAPPPHPRVPT